MTSRDITFSAAGATPAVVIPEYIEDVFSTWLYTGNGTGQTIYNGIQLSDALLVGGSGSFNGTSASLSFTTQTLSGQFTAEAWVYHTGINNPQILAAADADVSNEQLLRIFNNKQYTQFNSGGQVTGILDIPKNTWVHLAISRDASNVLRLFTNGCLAGSVTYATAITYGRISGTFFGGGDVDLFKGNISNVRVVSGTALYTANFVPPTTALTAVAGTQVLTCQGTTPFVDNSGNSLTITNQGPTTASTFGPLPAAGTGKGGLVWLKSRSAVTDNFLFDTARGALNELTSNATDGQVSLAGSLTSFNSNGFNLGSATGINVNAATYASWTFRDAPKFFDVVTYTGTGSAINIPHNLGSAPGMMIVKRTDATSNWIVYRRDFFSPIDNYLVLNTTDAAVSDPFFWGGSQPNSTRFQVGSSNLINASGGTFVAYLFAHDAGGFGAAGTDNVISCGSYTGTGIVNSPVLNLGYEPQFLLIKRTDVANNWYILDNMRGLPVGAAGRELIPNAANAEATNTRVTLNASGFQLNTVDSGFNASGGTYIYMAIRRPMKVPTSGTQVFSPVARTGTGANATVSSGFVTDTVIEGNRTSTTANSKFGVWNRLRGTGYNITYSTAAEVAAATTIIQANPWDVMDGYKVGTTGVLTNASTAPFINWMFKRAPGFHDVVCYTGTGDGLQNVPHNLGVLPELILIKRRNTTSTWRVANNRGIGNQLILNSTAASADALANSIGYAPTYLEFYNGADTNASGGTYVALLFASVAGVSKCGTYTGNGTSQTINCGFTTGARFVLIKRLDITGSWHVWDTARGIVDLNDPYLTLNTVNAEVTTNDSVDAVSTGFIVNQVATTGINVTSGLYTFMAIA